MGADPDQLRRDVEYTRARMATDVDVLSEKVNPKRIVQRRVDRTRGRLGRIKEQVMGTATSGMSTTGQGISSTASSVGDAATSAASSVGDAASSAASTVGDAATATTQTVRRQAEGSGVETVVADPARVRALRSYELLDAPRPAALDELTRMTTTMLGTPVALVTLVDEDRQWFAGNTGFALEQTGRDVSFCAHTLAPRSASRSSSCASACVACTIVVRGPSPSWIPPRTFTFADWIDGALDRSPTSDDLDYHLTTMFPPVRPRGK